MEPPRRFLGFRHAALEVAAQRRAHPEHVVDARLAHLVAQLLEEAARRFQLARLSRPPRDIEQHDAEPGARLGERAAVVPAVERGHGLAGQRERPGVVAMAAPERAEGAEQAPARRRVAPRLRAGNRGLHVGAGPLEVAQQRVHLRPRLQQADRVRAIAARARRRR